MEKLEVLGCPFLPVRDKEEMKSYVYSNIISKNIGGYSVAINAEKVVLYHKDHAVRNTIDNSILPSVDGGGITLGLKILRRGHFPRIDLPRAILELSHEKKLRLFILGAKDEINDLAVRNIKNEFPNINIVGRHHGYFKDEGYIIEKLKKANPQIVFIAMGSPRQELLSVEINKVLPQALFIGCGGAIDVFANLTHRAPKIIGDNHLEWLYRLVKKPCRIKRQKRLPVYMMMIFKEMIGVSYHK
jgi:N-acetylglucosaminyldiphosphoundecaprenol N-acetyl-beta-D-mannosaminyltransferase